MRKTGFLDSATMARTFSALRSNDLIFQYVANNWLQGNNPPSFDLLAWNEDSTRMPAPDAFGVLALMLSAQRICPR